jgi:hypothetical protein
VGIGRATIASALFHVGVLVALATCARLLPADPGVEASDHMQAMRGYLARTEAPVPTPTSTTDRVSSGDLDVTLGTIARAVEPAPAPETRKAVGARSPAPGTNVGGSNPCVAVESYWLYDPSGMREVHAPIGSSFKWVMELTDADQHPMPNVRYRAFLPDGRTFHEGTTDASGRVCFTGMDPNDRNVLLFFEKYGVSPVCATPQGEYPRDCADDDS